jgi:hypothetical protein
MTHLKIFLLKFLGIQELPHAAPNSSNLICHSHPTPSHPARAVHFAPALLDGCLDICCSPYLAQTWPRENKHEYLFYEIRLRPSFFISASTSHILLVRSI